MATLKIEVLGPGCRSCVSLDKLTNEVVAELGIDAEVTKVEDYAQIASYNVMSTPGLVIDGKVMLSGRVPKAAELRDLLSSAAKGQTAARGHQNLLPMASSSSCCSPSETSTAGCC